MYIHRKQPLVMSQRAPKPNYYLSRFSKNTSSQASPSKHAEGPTKYQFQQEAVNTGLNNLGRDGKLALRERCMAPNSSKV